MSKRLGGIKGCKYKTSSCVEGHYLHSTVYIVARYGLRVAFVWLCKSQTIEDHVLYHATVVSRCAS